MNTKMLALYAKALTHKPFVSECDKPDYRAGERHYNAITQAIVMPTFECEQNVVIHPSHCQKYNALTQWQPKLAALVHPNYIQTLSLPLQLKMMVHKHFVFSPMGLVHVANRIKVGSLPNQSDELHLRTYFGEVYWHKKGWLFEVLTSANTNSNKGASQPQVLATSYYLAREKHIDVARGKGNDLTKETPSDMSTPQNHSLVKSAPTWLSDISDKLTMPFAGAQSLSFASNIGRKYATISGDYNPIHLHPISAKIFGFRSAIAHGMFSKALVLSRLGAELSFYTGAFEVDTVFRQPICLPAKTLLSSQSVSNHVLDFALTSTQGRKERCYLSGEIRY